MANYVIRVGKTKFFYEFRNMFRLARFKTEHMPINDSKITKPIITNQMLSKIGLVVIASSLAPHSGKFREMTKGKFSAKLLF